MWSRAVGAARDAHRPHRMLQRCRSSEARPRGGLAPLGASVALELSALCRGAALTTSDAHARLRTGVCLTLAGVIACTNSAYWGRGRGSASVSWVLIFKMSLLLLARCTPQVAWYSDTAHAYYGTRLRGNAATRYIMTMALRTTCCRTSCRNSGDRQRQLRRKRCVELHNVFD